MSNLDFTDQGHPRMKTSIDPATAASFRLHSKRWGVRRIAASMQKKGYAIEVALMVLCGRDSVRPA